MLKLADVSEILNVSKRTVLNYIYSGELVAYKISGVYRIEKSDLDKFIQNNRVKGE